jgi:hypothetical protein
VAAAHVQVEAQRLMTRSSGAQTRSAARGTAAAPRAHAARSACSYADGRRRWL